ncbi:serine/threonine protein kinase [Streptomyces carpaticus]|uniref:serine/threonine-protein kinase n=1 Tax=Streptomyces carpaticus TaxID=285558 RepID=UPI002209ABF7|nr:serine/threonine protein kinase [Streptomyces carpaticus]
MDPLTPQDPRYIGDYRLLARLGEGGMGQVYLARSDRGRTVAVKTIRAELAREEDFRRRFALEITAARRVGGRWTAPVLDADTEAATPWVATGYIAGPSLHEVVGRDFGPLPERSVLLLANGLTLALRDIHTAGLVHRDLKPSNVLLTIDGPRVIDFGIARALEAGPGDGLTRTGATVGSPGFMSPEQIRGERLTPASDVFCLGSVLAYAATGRTPYGALDSGAHILLFRIAEEEPDLGGLPERIRGLIAATLAKDPAARPTLEDLERYTAAGPDGEPWLPGALVAQLGRHAVQLLDSEDPRSRVDHPAVRPAAGPAPQSAPAPAPPAPGPTAPLTPAGPPQQPHFGGPVPTPYGQSAPYGPPSGGFGPPSQQLYAHTGQGQPPPPARRRISVPAIVALCVAFVALVAGGVITANLISGNDSAAGSDITEEYLGAWQGEYHTTDDEGERVWHGVRLDVTQGDTGESVGTVTAVSARLLCAYDMRLSTFDAAEDLEFRAEPAWAVPSDAVGEDCPTPDTPEVQVMTATGTDGMTLAFAGEEIDLERGRGDRTPDLLVGEWGDSWTDEDEVEWTTTLTVTEGAIGEVMFTYEEWNDDRGTCVWENHLVQVFEREVVLGPDLYVAAGSDADLDTCGEFSAPRLTVGRGADDTITVGWVDDPGGRTLQFYRQ